MKKILILFFLATATMSSVGQSLDVRILQEVNVERNTNLDGTFKVITNSVFPLTVAVPAGFITYAIIKKDSASKANAINVSTSLIISGAITIIMKHVTQRDRPFVTYPFIEQETSGPGYSFPSGHTSTAFALATSVSIAYPKWYIIAPSYLWAGAVGYSRMHLGVHYPSDVLAGALIGTGSTFLSYKLTQWVNRKHKAKGKS